MKMLRIVLLVAMGWIGILIGAEEAPFKRPTLKAPQNFYFFLDFNQ
jgi:hypothetical protein